MPVVSVILPVYNHLNYLPAAISSVLCQTFADFELLILNDDPRLDLVDFCLLDKRIKVFQDGRHLGQAYRLNEGICLASGEFIAFHDADDYAVPQRLEISLNNITGFDVLYGDAVVVDRASERYIKSPLASRELVARQSVGVFASTFVHRVVAIVNPFRPFVGYGNDRIWWIDLLAVGAAVKKVNVPLYYYRNYSSNFRRFQNVPVLRKIWRWKRDVYFKDLVKKVLDEYR